MRLFCDMDMVLVHQKAAIGFDAFPWMPDGKLLWGFIKAHRPTLLTQVREERFGLTAQEKLKWINRELGPQVPVIFTPDSRGKGPFARPGDLLIDDADKHCADWRANGGVAVQHRSAEKTIAALQAILKAGV